jgi:hypothetical protein
MLSRSLPTFGLLILVGCGAVEETPHAPDAGEEPPAFFIATQSDFANYKSWPKFIVAGEGVDAGSSGSSEHGAGVHIAYVNHRPSHGSEQFPTGTIIVKETLDANGAASSRIHAMVKRNGGFNEYGAHGWEWFELTPSTQGVPVVRWRGPNPPGDSSYDDELDDNPTGDCNTCHAVAVANDHVRSGPLKLTGF